MTGFALHLLRHGAPATPGLLMGRTDGAPTEAGIAAIEWAFAHLGWDRIIHSIHPDNTASQRLAERLGSRNLGPVKLPAPYEDSPTDFWGQTRADQSARRSPPA